MSGSAPAALAAATAFSSLAFSGAAWAVRGPSSSVFAPSVWRGARGRKAVALTFDDGPTPGTAEILDILRRYGAPATFFQIGANVLTFPDLANAVAAAGHETGNHSHTHPNFALARPNVIDAEFERAQNAIRRVTGSAPRLLRAPYGVRWFGFRAMQKRLGLTGVMWSVIGLDWKLPAAAVAGRVLSRIQDGGIVCLHDGRGTLKDCDIGPTIEAVKRIVPNLLEKGYHFETVSRILCPTI